MEIVKPIWLIYNMFDRMKNNDMQCPHIMERLKALEELLVFFNHKTPDQLTDNMREALEKFNKTVLSAVELIRKFMEAHKMNHMVKSTDYKLEFENLNKSLTDTFVTLSVALHINQEKRLDQQEVKLMEQERKLGEHQRRIAEQEDKLAEQEDILQRVESKLAHGSRAYYCILQ